MFFSLLICTGSVTASAAVNVVKTAEVASSGEWEISTSGNQYKDASGIYAKSVWLNIDGGIYYFDSKGNVCTGWFTYKKNHYYADATGRIYVKQWKKTGSYRYYFRANGVMARNRWVLIDGKYYYFNSKGRMLKSQWIDGYYVGKKGYRLTDCKVDGCELDSTGKKVIKKTIFVGDSRTVGMQSAVSASDTLFIGKVGSGYSWLVSSASSTLASYIKKYSSVQVIFAFGVNDLYNSSNYISYYKSLIANYPQVDFYIMAVNPVKESVASSHGYTVTNSQIRAFNKKIKAAFSSVYLNTYSYLNKKGFGTSDGIHYTAATYKKIYKYVIKAIS